MKPPVIFDESLVAPCGMNCGTCIAFLRRKNKCRGCRVDSPDKLKSRLLCTIKICHFLERTDSTFCYDCETFPCRRLKQIDKRYRTKYQTSFVQNLLIIKETGMANFLAFESERRTCPDCGSVLSVHRKHCLACKNELPES
jgi:hypothetical protein